jgi:hypothetical protein
MTAIRIYRRSTGRFVVADNVRVYGVGHPTHIEIRSDHHGAVMIVPHDQAAGVERTQFIQPFFSL